MPVELRLVPATASLLDAALAGDAALAALLAAEITPGWAVFPEAIAYVRSQLGADDVSDPWGSYFFVAAAPHALAGMGGFKGPPDGEGRVELGYAIAESRRGQGLATAAARALVEQAFADPRVSSILAHTLPEENASTGVLRKLGFVHLGPVETPGEGTVWRFSLTRPGL